MFIDIHCHVDFYKNIDEIIKKSKESNVKIIVSNGINSENNKKILKLSEKFLEIKAAVGIYPTEGLKMSDLEIEKEIEFIKKNKKHILAIGEVGMDFKESTNEKEHIRQELIFKKFIDLSMELDKPIIVHSRKAEKECIEILEKSKIKKVIMHCFSGNMKLVEKIEKNGWMISIPTSVKNSEHFQKIIEKVSINTLLCETDSPFLHPDKEKNNVPSNVIESYKKISEIKKIKLNDVEKSIEKNYNSLFKHTFS